MSEPKSAILSKVPVATSLSSRRLSALDREAKERALFSARTTEQRYVDAMQGVLEAFTGGDIGEGEARRRLTNLLDAFGYTPERGFAEVDDDVPAATPNTITDLSSFGRLNLVVDTNAGMAASVSRLAEETDDTLDLFPAWRLTRFMWPNGKPRDWELRWAAAGNSVGWQGACREEMVARKDSPIWQALGDGAGGFSDTLGNPYPPFAFNSGMGWEDVDRDEAEGLGLELDEPVRVEPPSLAVSEEEVADVRGRFGDVFADAMMDVIRAYNEEPADAAANTECHVVGRPCRIHDKAQGGVPKRNDGLDEFTRQPRKFQREQEYLDQFKASDDHPTCEEVVEHTVPELMKDLERGFTADFGGGHKVVFCLKNLVEKYGDERSSKFDLSRLRALRIALARRYSFASIPHRGNQVAFIEQGRMPAGVNRIVIVASRHGNDLVARNVMRNTDDYVRSSFKFNPC